LGFLPEIDHPENEGTDHPDDEGRYFDILE
jgi:hypothetical protein